MELRKVQMSASGSFFVTLPKSWVKSAGLEKGHIEVAVDEDGSLRLLPPKMHIKPPRSAALRLVEFLSPTVLERQIKTCYIQGCDVIRVSSDRVITPEEKSLIKKSIMDLVGTEILEEYSDKITIQTIIDPAKFSMDTLIQRIHALVFSMHQDAVESFKKRDKALATDVIMREKEVEKLYTLALRQMFIAIGNKELQKGVSARKVWNCVMSIVAARDLSRMSHYAVDIAKQVMEIDKSDKIDKGVIEQILKMSEIASKMSEDAKKAFFEDNFMLADEVISKLDEARELHYGTDLGILSDKSGPHVAIILMTICKDLNRIASFAAEIAHDEQRKFVLTSDED